ncbi:MAG: hypothetical protein HY962_12990 [Ignavibacteriae bacterium]|nr:hypothetical protein [Ignavibacteriota bacterium]
MRKLSGMYLAGLLLAGLCVYDGCVFQSRSDDVVLHPPDAVRKAVDSRFAGATLRSWAELISFDSTRGDTITTYFDATIFHSGRTYRLVIQEDSGILGWEKEIRRSEIPPPVKDSVMVDAGRETRISAAFEITTVSGSSEEVKGYRIELRESALFTRVLYVTKRGSPFGPLPDFLAHLPTEAGRR